MSNWSTLPSDLYERYNRDRILTALLGIAKFYEAATQLSRWRPEDVPLVNRQIEGIVTQRDQLADDVIALTLKDPQAGLFPVWNPGAHIDLLLPSGRKRQYSLCGNPHKRTEYKIAVRRIADGGGGSIEVHDHIKVGDTITFEGPHNAFHFCTQAGKVLFLIGGIGITAMLPMVKVARERKLDWHAVYVGTSLDRMPFVEELKGIDTSRVEIWTSADRGGRPSVEQLLSWADHTTSVYICGPVAMMNMVIAARDAHSNTPLYYERFSPPPVIDGTPFSLELAKSGITLEIPADRSALDVILDVNPNFAYSCRQGFCGTCKLKVLQGEVHHLAKGGEADDEILICTSRAIGDKLVVDA